MCTYLFEMLTRPSRRYMYLNSLVLFLLNIQLVFFFSVCASSVNYHVLKWVCKLYLYIKMIYNTSKSLWHDPAYEYLLYFIIAGDQHGAKWPESWAFKKIFILRCLRQYIIHFKLIYMFELLPSSRIHTYITHIYQESIETGKDTAQ